MVHSSWEVYPALLDEVLLNISALSLFFNSKHSLKSSVPIIPYLVESSVPPNITIDAPRKELKAHVNFRGSGKCTFVGMCGHRLTRRLGTVFSLEPNLTASSSKAV